MLKWFNYPRARAHPGCKVGSHGAESTCIVSSSVLHQGQPDSLVAKFPQCSVIACSMQISCCKGGTLRTRPQTGVYKPDVVVHKAHQRYVSSAHLPSDSLCKNLAWWAVTRRTLNNHKTVKSGRWALARIWVLAQDNTVFTTEVASTQNSGVHLVVAYMRKKSLRLIKALASLINLYETLQNMYTQKSCKRASTSSFCSSSCVQD